MHSDYNIVESILNSPYKHKRSTESNMHRANDRFNVTGNLIKKKDRLNKNILKSVLYEQKIKDINDRLTLPTCSTSMRSEVLHPTMKGHDVNTIEVWSNMSNYDNHFLKRMYDKKGNSRIFNNKQILGADGFKPLPQIVSYKSKDVNFHPLPGSNGFSYKQQWTTNQTIHNVDFKKSSNRSI